MKYGNVEPSSYGTGTVCKVWFYPIRHVPQYYTRARVHYDNDMLLTFCTVRTEYLVERVPGMYVESYLSLVRHGVFWPLLSISTQCIAKH